MQKRSVATSREKSEEKQEVEKEWKSRKQSKAIWRVFVGVLIFTLGLSYLTTETLTFGHDLHIPTWKQLLKKIKGKSSRIISMDELAMHGPDADEIWVSIDGQVFDVSAGRAYYGEQGSYNFFSGRDASRAYVTGCFKDHLTHDLRGLSLEELKGVREWAEFYFNHDTYQHVGQLAIPSLDSSVPIPPDCEKRVKQKQKGK